MQVEKAPPGVDVSRPSIARVYDAMLGGKDNFAVDRSVLERMLESVPDIQIMARDNRRWVRRVAAWLTSEVGIDQFLDVGSGLPTVENTHDVVHRIDPDASVVYVDNDPAVIAHGRVLLADDEHTFFAAGDLTRPDELLADPAVTGHLDLTRPLGVLHCLTLHHVGDEEAHRIVRGYTERMAPGSYLAVSHIRLPEPDDARRAGFMAAMAGYQAASPDFTPRRLADVGALLAGLELVEPGVVPVVEWWPEGPPLGEPYEFAEFLVGGVARRP
ncbi:MAG: SAM-dependent methyltransferase [Acidothermales bacterium]|nr:SAM-dependent methyltransferase [Acidothermales bacterium]